MLFARTMAINARVISGSDPGAVPGGSTNLTGHWTVGEGPKQDRRTCKDDAFARLSSVRSSSQHSCQWQLCWRWTPRCV